MMLTVYTLLALDLMAIAVSFGVAQKHVLLLGGPLYYVGILTSVTAVLSFFWKPIAGRLSDTRDPTQVMIWCLLASAIGNIATGFSNTLYILMFSRMIQVLGSPLQGLFRNAMTALKDEDRSKMLNKIGIINSASLIVGSLTGGFLSEFENGVTYRYTLMALFNVISIVLVKQLPKKGTQNQVSDGSSPVEKATNEIKAALKSMATFFVSEKYGNIFMMKAILESIIQFRQTALLYQFTVGLGFTGRQIGYIISTIFLWNILVNMALLKTTKTLYPEDKGDQRVLHSLVLTILSMLGQALCPGTAASVFFLLLGEISNAVVENAMMELFLEEVEESEKGVAMNSFGSVRSLSELTMPLACNASLGAVGVPLTFLGGGVMAVGAAVVSVGRLGGGRRGGKEREE